jgi:hypothetical protein
MKKWRKEGKKGRSGQRSGERASVCVRQQERQKGAGIDLWSFQGQNLPAKSENSAGRRKNLAFQRQSASVRAKEEKRRSSAGSFIT